MPYFYVLHGLDQFKQCLKYHKSAGVYVLVPSEPARKKRVLPVLIFEMFKLTYMSSLIIVYHTHIYQDESRSKPFQNL